MRRTTLVAIAAITLGLGLGLGAGSLAAQPRQDPRSPAAGYPPTRVNPNDAPAGAMGGCGCAAAPGAAR